MATTANISSLVPSYYGTLQSDKFEILWYTVVRSRCAEEASSNLNLEIVW